MRRKMLFLVVMMLFAVSARAQYRASIQGVVTDPAGAVVSGATLTLTNLDTNLQLTATSDENGVYNFNALPSSKFSLTVEKAGFKKKTLANVGIIAEQANALNVQLELGQVTETVTVSGDSTPLMDTETASLSGLVNSNQMEGSPAARTASSRPKTARRSFPVGNRPRITAFRLTASAPPAPFGAVQQSSHRPKIPSIASKSSPIAMMPRMGASPAHSFRLPPRAARTTSMAVSLSRPTSQA